MNTQDCQFFLTHYFNSKNIKTNESQWELQKKYKNFDGVTCRDFINNNFKIKVIVIVDENEVPSVIENANFEYFLKERASKNTFYYLPLIKDNKINYFFVKKSFFDNKGNSLASDIQSEEILLKLLQSIFKVEDISISGYMLMSFPNIHPNEVIKKLNQSCFNFNDKIIENLPNKASYAPYYSEVLLAKFENLEYKILNQEQSVDKLLRLCSHKRDFTIEDYAKIHSLLGNISLSEIKLLKNIIENMRFNKDKTITLLIKEELAKTRGFK